MNPEDNLEEFTRLEEQVLRISSNCARSRLPQRPPGAVVIMNSVGTAFGDSEPVPGVSIHSLGNLLRPSGAPELDTRYQSIQ